MVEEAEQPVHVWVRYPAFLNSRLNLGVGPGKVAEAMTARIISLGVMRYPAYT
jgi:hypothetical protein